MRESQPVFNSTATKKNQGADETVNMSSISKIDNIAEPNIRYSVRYTENDEHDSGNEIV